MGHAEVIVRMDSDVSDLRQHGDCLLVGWILFKVAAFCQQGAAAVLSFEFRVSPRPETRNIGYDNCFSENLTSDRQED